MYYENIRKGRFLARPNRFIAHVELADGGAPHPSPAGTPSPQGEGYVVCHVKNTGRCKELLVPGAAVYVQECGNPNRKTKFDLIAVEKTTPSVPSGDALPSQERKRLINMDAQAPNKVFGEWLAAGGMGFVPTFIKPETTYGKSRFDFYWETEEQGGMDHAAPPPLALPERPGEATPPPSPILRRGFIEVKGVTLEDDGAVYFPDAPTERGVKHIEELIACKAAGYEAAICFVIQMSGVRVFSPNDATHLAFGDALRRAAAAGVTILAYDCAVTPHSLTIDAPVPIAL